MENLLPIITILQQAYSRRLFQRMFSSVISLLGLMMVAAILLSAMLMGGLVAAYFLLMQYGVEPRAAMLVISIVALMLIAILFAIIRWRLRLLRQMPSALGAPSPITSLATDTLNAFLNGLMAE